MKKMAGVLAIVLLLAGPAIGGNLNENDFTDGAFRVTVKVSSPRPMGNINIVIRSFLPVHPTFNGFPFL